jgi:hypothetical protein
MSIDIAKQYKKKGSPSIKPLVAIPCAFETSMPCLKVVSISAIVSSWTVPAARSEVVANRRTAVRNISAIEVNTKKRSAEE